MNEPKSLKSHFKFHTSIAILPADKDRAAIIPNHEDYLEKCIDHIHNAPRHLFKKRYYHQNESRLWKIA